MSADILVVEDEAIVAHDICGALQRFGYSVCETAASAEDALRIASAKFPSLALLDIRIRGDVDGIVAAHRLRELGVPVVFLTSYSDEPTLARARVATPFGYLLKPFDEQQLRATIEIALFKHAAEQEVSEARERYRALFNDSPWPAFMVDADSGRVLEVNDSAISLYGYTRPDLLTSHVSVLDDDLAARIASLASGGEVAQLGVCEHRRKDGSIVEVDVAAHGLQLGGRRAILVVARDVTTQRRLEEELRQAQKMEAVGKLAGGVAHDFNNLLTAILSYASMLRRDPETGPRLRADLEEIERAGRRAADLTRQLLEFSRTRPATTAILDPNEVVDGLGKMLRRVLGEDIEFVTLLHPSAGLIRAERGRLEQLVTNLVVNARDAMPGGGKLVIETSGVLLDASYAAEHVEATVGPHFLLEVRDTGAGMAPATLARIFEPFFTTKELGKGTGLGLATVYGIVRQGGGHLRVESEIGKGTTFRIYLPQADAEAAPRPSIKRSQPVPAGTETVLLVEDEEQVRKATVRALRRLGYEVLEAQDGEEALALWAQHGPGVDLLVTDVVLPKLSGPEVVARLRSSRPDLKVLVMSGYAEEAPPHLEQAWRDLPFLPKPFTSSDLASKVREVLDG